MSTHPLKIDVLIIVLGRRYGSADRLSRPRNLDRTKRIPIGRRHRRVDDGQREQAEVNTKRCKERDQITA